VGDLIEAMGALAEKSASWKNTLRVLGERLARTCSRLCIARWSLYTIRHVAIATWKRAGLKAAEIAALCGHRSTRTARLHYTGSRHGWAANYACVRPNEELVAWIAERNIPRGAAVAPPLDAISQEQSDPASSTADDPTSTFVLNP
jgi:hypothetical protein